MMIDIEDYRPYVPTPREEIAHLEVIEAVAGPLIDVHLKWVEQDESPMKDLNFREYGYLPQRYTDKAKALENPRPNREPIDSIDIMTKVLGLDYDTEFWKLAQKVDEVDNGWYDYLLDKQVMSPELIKAMREISEKAFRTDGLTEDNLSIYIATILGGFEARANRWGLQIPGSIEWSKGIWGADEFGHLDAMNDYGKIRGITSSRKHRAGRNSQLRAGMEAQFGHPIALNGYVGWQEPSTNISHENDASLFGPVGAAILYDISANEAQHGFFYEKVTAELVKYFADQVIRTMYDLYVAQDPFMPGSKGSPEFITNGAFISAAGIFDKELSYGTLRKFFIRTGIFTDKEIPELSDTGIFALAALREKYDKEFIKPRGKAGRFVLEQTITKSQLRELRAAYSTGIGLPNLGEAAKAKRMSTASGQSN